MLVPCVLVSSNLVTLFLLLVISVLLLFHQGLAEVEMERKNYAGALYELGECLTKRRLVLPRDSR